MKKVDSNTTTTKVHQMASLQDFVKEQKKHRNNNNAYQNGLSDFGSKLSEKFGNFASTFASGGNSNLEEDDQNQLIIDEGSNGQLPSGQNRKNQTGWFGTPWRSLTGGNNGETFFGLSKMQRMIGFIFCLFAAGLCFATALMLLPVVVLQARKFAALNTLGSCFTIFSFALIWGPLSYVHHLFSKPRLPVTLSYFLSVMATLYCALWIQNAILTITCACIQFICLIWFILSYVPGGERGLRLMTSLFTRTVTKSQSSKTVLPI